jgi:DNA-binding XRE family transcriptional regulator
VTEVQPESGPTVGRMLIGSTLRRLRTEKGITRDEAADVIRASAWKIHRMENGQVGFKDRDLVDLLRLYGVTDQEEIAALLEISRAANSPG